MARYSWIRRTLQNDWADHWWQTAEGFETVNQIHRWMTEGINRPGNTFSNVLKVPIMSKWTRRVHKAILELPDDQQMVIFERYMGPHFGRHFLDEWCKSTRMKGWRFQKLLSKAQHSLTEQIAPEKLYRRALTDRLLSSTLPDS